MCYTGGTPSNESILVDLPEIKLFSRKTFIQKRNLMLSFLKLQLTVWDKNYGTVSTSGM